MTVFDLMNFPFLSASLVYINDTKHAHSNDFLGLFQSCELLGSDQINWVLYVLHWDREALSFSFDNYAFFKLNKKAALQQNTPSYKGVQDWVVLTVLKWILNVAKELKPCVSVLCVPGGIVVGNWLSCKCVLKV